MSLILSPAKPSVLSLPLTYAVEALGSFACTFLMTGIFFFTEKRFGWGLMENYLLAAGQGVVYVVGALLANRMQGVLGRRNLLIAVFLIAAALAAGAALAVQWPWAVVVLLLAYSFITAASWPALESMVTAGADAHQMSRRVGMYNFMWGATGAMALALTGIVIKASPTAIFFVTAAAHGLSVLLLLGITNVRWAPGGHAQPEPQLLARRTLALWLSRLSLPASYVVVYTLVPLLPSLPAVAGLDESMRSATASIWMFCRVAAFVILGLLTFWHTRPAVLVAASVALLVSVAVTLAGGSATAGVPLFIVGQVLLGLSLGLIYSGSLYFGMVLSEGSTEHGGYHEALIGAGQVLGPGLCFAATLAAGTGGVYATMMSLVAAGTIATTLTAVAAARKSR